MSTKKATNPKRVAVKDLKPRKDTKGGKKMMGAPKIGEG